MNDKLSAIEIYKLILDLRSMDSDKCSNSIKYIPTIAKALGPPRTSSELIPYLVETATFNETNWINVLGKVSEIEFEKYTSQQQIASFQILCALCEMESRAIRTSYVECMAKITHRLPEDSCKSVIQPLIQTMLADDSPTIRASAVMLFSETIDVFNAQIKSGIFTSACKDLEKDPVIIVRQSFATSSPKLVDQLKGALATKLYSIMLEFASDPSFSVCCEVPKFLIQYMKTNGNIDKVKEIGEKLSKSNNWRVRCMYIASLTSIFQGSNAEFKDIFPIIENAANDTEDEVKTAAAEQLPLVVVLKGVQEAKKQVQGLIERLISSPCPHVKTSAVNALPLFYGIIDNDFITSNLIKLSVGDSREVTITALESLKSPKIPYQTKLKCLAEGSSTTEWREKYSLAQVLPQIASEGDSDNELVEIVAKLLKDDAHDVRQIMLSELNSLNRQNGNKLAKLLLPTLKECINSDDYQLRQMSLTAIINLELYDNEGMKILEQGVKDSVSNVRIRLARACVSSFNKKGITNIIAKLKNDSDEDVCDIVADL